jgi:hypothetical protein
MAGQVRPLYRARSKRAPFLRTIVASPLLGRRLPQSRDGYVTAAGSE